MTPQQARQVHPADVVDLAEDLSDATSAVVSELPDPTRFVCDTYDETCRRVAAHDQARTIQTLAFQFGKFTLGVPA